MPGPRGFWINLNLKDLIYSNILNKALLPSLQADSFIIPGSQDEIHQSENSAILGFEKICESEDLQVSAQK